MVQTIFAFGLWACNRGRPFAVVSTQPGLARCRTLSLMGSAMPIELHSKTHIDIYDRAAREHWAHRFGVTEERLRKAVTMVGSRLSTVADYLGQPAP